jgi:hypothetical protein
MQMMKIRSDLPIKYRLNIYNDELVQDEFSALYNILQYLLKVNENKNKELKLNSLKFTTNSLKYIFGEKIKDDEFKCNLIKKIKYLIQEKYIEVKGENFFITQLAINYFYEIND